MCIRHYSKLITAMWKDINSLTANNNLCAVQPQVLVEKLQIIEKIGASSPQMYKNLTHQLPKCINNYSTKQIAVLVKLAHKNNSLTQQLASASETAIANNSPSLIEFGEGINAFVETEYLPMQLISLMKAYFRKGIEPSHLVYHLLYSAAYLEHKDKELARIVGYSLSDTMHKISDKLILGSMTTILLFCYKYEVTLKWDKLFESHKQLFDLYPSFDLYSNRLPSIYSNYMDSLSKQQLTKEQLNTIYSSCINIDKYPLLVNKICSVLGSNINVTSNQLIQIFVDSKIPEEKADEFKKALENLTLKQAMYILQNKSPLNIEEQFMKQFEASIVKLVKKCNSYEFALMLRHLKDSNMESQQFWTEFIMASKQLKVEKFHELILIQQSYQYLQIKYNHAIFKTALEAIDSTINALLN